MKTLILIIVLLLIGFGAWWFMRDPEVAVTEDNSAEVVEVEAEVNLDEFQDKG
ncbi:MAG: hypothetical protein AAB780_00640 [Patescibacteria group bacterium]